MTDPQAATATQLRNIEAKTGKSLAELRAVVAHSGLAKHGEVRAMLIERFGLGYGDANALAHAAKAAAPATATADDPLDAIYAGNKAALRPLHDHLMARIAGFGAFEVAPKKAYVSLRRKKQFAMLGPATQTQLELGLNAKGLPADARLKAMPPGGMCQYTVRLSTPAEVDARLLAWLRTAFDAAG
jgi:hypothetical protein